MRTLAYHQSGLAPPGAICAQVEFVVGSCLALRVWVSSLHVKSRYSKYFNTTRIENLDKKQLKSSLKNCNL